jgi:hypothetical protein
MSGSVGATCRRGCATEQTRPGIARIFRPKGENAPLAQRSPRVEPSTLWVFEAVKIEVLAFLAFDRAFDTALEP